MQQHITSEKKGSQKGFLKIRIIENLETIAILQVSKEMKRRVFVIKIWCC